MNPRILLFGLLMAGAIGAASILDRPRTGRAESETAAGLGDLVDSASAISESLIDRIIEQGLVRPAIDGNDPLLAGRKIVISNEINAISAREVVTKLFLLADASPTEPIDLYIRTNGGWQDDALAICDAMAAIPAPVNTWAMGSCDSAGALILAAGTGRRRVLPHALVGLHFVEEEGDAPRSLERRSLERTMAFWKRHAKLPEEICRYIGDEWFSLTPEEAVKFGVADEVVPFRRASAGSPR